MGPEGGIVPSPATALVLIDVQRGFDNDHWGVRNNPAAEAAIAQLAARWRAAGAPLFHVRHSSVNAGSPLHRSRDGFQFKPEAQPLAGEPVYTKQVNSGFIGTDLERDLRAAGVRTLVMAGFTTDHCVSTTARMGANLGFAVCIAADACVTHNRTDPWGASWSAEQMHRTALASLANEFALVANTAELLAGGGAPTPVSGQG